MSPVIVDFLRKSFGREISPQRQTVGDSFVLFFRRVAVLCTLAASFFLVTFFALLVTTAPRILVIVGSVALIFILSVPLIVNVFSKRPERMVHIIWYIIVGFTVGLIAHAILPGAQHLGFIMTSLLGISGSIVGGLIGRLFSKPEPDSAFHPAGLILSIIGAIILLSVILGK
jgi:uncharacterized membrane protein YeaQ/YmgE (transglycosylase-associated protein family)